MALTKKQYEHIKEELDNCKNPLYFFDDDPDGLSAFLLLYRYKREGHGLVVKTHPTLDIRSVPRLEDYKPDKVFVLDVANLEQDFIDNCPEKIIWIDHHGPHIREDVHYFNPRVENKDDNLPTTFLCYNAVKQDLWIAMVGCIADYYLPNFLNEFKKKYPGIIKNEKTVPEIYFKSELGKLIKIFSFALKGQIKDVMKRVKILTRIKSPFEILNQETPQGKFLFKHYEKSIKDYDALLKDALKTDDKGKLFVFTYQDDKTSFTGDLSNEISYRFPDKLVIIGRKKDDEVRMSLRSTKMKIPSILEKALAGLEGYGGGHELACGANVKQKDFEEFTDRLRKSID